MKAIWVSLLVAGLIGILALIAPSAGNAQDKIALFTEQDAISRMLEYTGFDGLDSFDKSANNITAILEKVDTVKLPFLWREFVGQELWVVKITQVRLEDRRLKEDRKYDSVTRSFTAYLDPKTGNLLRLHSADISGGKYEYNQEPSLKAIEDQMKGNERFIGFPKEPVKLSFLDALTHTNTTWYDAKEIVAYCAKYTTNGWRDTMDVWSIDFRGFPLDKWLGPHAYLTAEGGKGHQRNVIDANTGWLYLMTSIPVYDASRDIKK